MDGISSITTTLGNAVMLSIRDWPLFITQGAMEYASGMIENQFRGTNQAFQYLARGITNTLSHSVYYAHKFPTNARTDLAGL